MARLGTAGKKGTRPTTVDRMPFWIPDDESDPTSPHGEWRFLPVGKTHNQMVSQQDPDDPEVPAFVQTQYEAKGWIPYPRVPKNDERHGMLPENFREMMKNHRAVARFPADAPTKSERVKAKA